MDIFSATEYKEILRLKIQENSALVGYKGKLALAAGCQRAYLSQVLSSQVHLTPDHAAGLARFWNLIALETDYFLDLVNLARAASPALKNLITQKLQTIKLSQQTVDGRIKKPKVETLRRQSQYYSSWHYSAIHILVTIAKFRSVAAIGQRLHLSEELTLSALQALEELQLVKREGEKWLPATLDLHLPTNSPLSSTNHLNWRQRAVLASQVEKTDSVHFTGVFSVSEKDFELIKGRLLAFLAETRENALQSKEEELIAVTCDAFRVR